MPSLLARIFRRHVPAVELVSFGPRYLVSGDRLTIESGPLAGTVLRVERKTSNIKADFTFYSATNGRSPVAADPVAHCHFDRDPETGTETFWDVFIRADYRNRGLTSLLTRLTFRELLAAGKRHWFAIRKLMQVDSEAGRRGPLDSRPSPVVQSPLVPRITLRNLGIGLVAVRLGFQPEPDIERFLAPGNVKAVQALPAEPPTPPGLLLRLGTLPGLLVAALLDIDTGRPVTSTEAYERFVSPRHLLRQAFAGHAIIGNIDYVLPRSAAETLAARLADNHGEYKHFAAALRRGARN
jgi:hypothetical protein